MSLEQTLKDNTEAVKENTETLRELIALLKEGNALPISKATEKVIETAKKSPLQAGESLTKGMREEMKAPAETAKNYAAPGKEDAPAVPGTVAETEPLDFQEHIVKPFGKLCVAKGREAGAAILAKWGVDKLSKIPADKYADLMVDIINASV